MGMYFPAEQALTPASNEFFIDLIILFVIWLLLVAVLTDIL